ncbi:MAG TPA: hypothetical protein VF546_10035 [Pyrinomonadaceae bacterium]|jgi:membrane protease subunit (stomatin/prohibitin family)
MALVQFVRNYDDLSTDKGFQFKFYCDKCGNGYLTRYQASTLGTASSFLRAAGDLFGGWASSAGNSAYEVQRAVGGKAHDDALEQAVAEGKAHFHQCSRCGRWVCPEVCWNANAGQCEECAPDYKEEFAAAHAQAKRDAAREQLYERARRTDYASQTDMSADAYAAAPPPTPPARSTTPAAEPTSGAADGPLCLSCGAGVGRAKFCPECGTPTQRPKPTCAECGHQPEGTPKFCPECGAKF